MSVQNNSRPAAPVVVVKEQDFGGISLLLLVPAVIASVVFNGGLMVVLYFVFQAMPSYAATAMESVKDPPVVNAEPDSADKIDSKEKFLTQDVNPDGSELNRDI